MDTIHYMGHSGFEISIRDYVILIDPFFGSGLKESCKILTLEPSMIKRADLILLTHEHLAHADVNAVEKIASRTGASVVGPAETLQNINLKSQQKVDVRVGDSFTLKGIDLTVTRAVHPQSIYPVGYIIKDYVKIYHAGDTYQFTEMKNIEVDYAMLPIGGSYTMDPVDAANATKLLTARYIIPMHYNTTDKITQDLAEFKRMNMRGKLIIMDPDEAIEIVK